MTSTISDVRDALGAQLRSELGGDINVDVDNEGKPPPVVRLFLGSPPVQYWGTFGANGLHEVRFLLTIDPAGNDRSAVRRLDEYLSVGTGNGRSVIDALLSDVSLGGIAQTLRVDGFDYGESLEPDPSVTATLEVLVTLKKQGANA